MSRFQPDHEQGFDEYEEYESQFDPMYSNRRARRRRRPKAHHTPKKSEGAVLESIAQKAGLEGGFETTYQPGLFEEGWLLESLRGFYDQHLITDVLSRVKGGKEANVYCCEASPAVGTPLVAAKVYRPRMFRNLRNDKAYREGRPVLTTRGHEVKKNDHRIMRAIGKKSAYGEQVAHTSWLMHEYTTLHRLYDAGGAVPRPIAASENTVLMSYHGDERSAAPTLNSVDLDYEELEPLFAEVMRNVRLLLRFGLVHGDLSAYNILYWRGKITLIDFPQVVRIHTNRNAPTILARDIQRIVEYFAQQGLERDPDAIARELWAEYGIPAPDPLDGWDDN